MIDTMPWFVPYRPHPPTVKGGIHQVPVAGDDVTHETIQPQGKNGGQKAGGAQTSLHHGRDLRPTPKTNQDTVHQGQPGRHHGLFNPHDTVGHMLPNPYEWFSRWSKTGKPVSQWELTPGMQVYKDWDGAIPYPEEGFVKGSDGWYRPVPGSDLEKNLLSVFPKIGVSESESKKIAKPEQRPQAPGDTVVDPTDVIMGPDGEWYPRPGSALERTYVDTKEWFVPYNVKFPPVSKHRKLIGVEKRNEQRFHIEAGTPMPPGWDHVDAQPSAYVPLGQEAPKVTTVHYPYSSTKHWGAEPAHMSHTSAPVGSQTPAPVQNAGTAGPMPPPQQQLSARAGFSFPKPVDYSKQLTSYVHNMTFQDQVALAKAAKQNWILSVERANMLY